MAISRNSKLREVLEVPEAVAIIEEFFPGLQIGHNCKC